MARTRTVEIFSAGCDLCTGVIDMVKRLACNSCEVQVVDVFDHTGAERAARLGVRSLPTVAVDGVLAQCCTGRGVDEATLVASGIGQPTS